jgi:NAD(P)H-dependent FMN reductase
MSPCWSAACGQSLNRKIAQALIALAPPSLKLEIVEIGELPLYNEDIDGATPPASYTTFRERIRRADAVLFVTPEYNRSVPAPMKNAIDVGSRPYGKSAWSGKPGGGQRFAGRHRWLRRQPPPAPVAGVPRCALHATAGSLPGRRRRLLR